jgi:hypothetical protein
MWMCRLGRGWASDGDGRVSAGEGRANSAGKDMVDVGG